MRLTVVGKIILGFALFACLLLITNLVSYLGLQDIRSSANSVVEEKMPIQARMLDVQSGLLELSNITTKGFYSSDLEQLDARRAGFESRLSGFRQSLSELQSLLGSSNALFSNGQSHSEAYFTASTDMFLARKNQLSLQQELNQQLQGALTLVNEASGLMLDLGYLESKDPDLDRLIGTGTNIDNKLQPMLTALKELANNKEAKASADIQEDIRFAFSNIDADAQYMNRLAENIDTEDMVTQFNDQYQRLKLALENPAGLFAMQQKKLTELQHAEQARRQAETELEAAQSQFSELYSQVNQATLAGQDEILSVVQSNLIKGFAIMLVAMAGVVLLGVILARNISRPLHAISGSLAEMGKGDLTQRAEASGNDEFSQLAASVNTLSASLQEVVEQIHQQESRLNQATNNSVELGHQSLQQVETQRDEVLHVAEDTSRVREASNANVVQITEAMSQLRQIDSQSADVSALVKQSADHIRLQAKQAQQSADIVGRLDENSNRIGSILDVIKTIAEQTNLLALNAAIEAARAGEQGRGFAVVADEVRTLANRTHQSTEEIEAMIASLQQDAKQAVEAIGTGRQQAEQNVGLIESVNSQVLAINDVITSLALMNQKIVADSEEQDSLLQQAVERLQAVVQLTEDNAETTRQSTASVEEVQHLNQALKQAVSRFKI